MKIILNDVNNVGELKKALSNIPDDTQFTTFGLDNCKLAYVEKSNIMYLDEDFSWLIEEVESYEEKEKMEDKIAEKMNKTIDAFIECLYEKIEENPNQPVLTDKTIDAFIQGLYKKEGEINKPRFNPNMGKSR